jgi:hypothetical protein
MNTTPLIIECSMPGKKRCGSAGPVPASPDKPEPAVTLGRVPRVSRLMALALRFEQLCRDGGIADYAALARLGHVSRARISQIVSLVLLAPDIQETVLYLPCVRHGRDPICLRMLLNVAAQPNWQRQRVLWQRLRGIAPQTAARPS